MPVRMIPRLAAPDLLAGCAPAGQEARADLPERLTDCAAAGPRPVIPVAPIVEIEMVCAKSGAAAAACATKPAAEG